VLPAANSQTAVATSKGKGKGKAATTNERGMAANHRREM
jgi:hypothetical protein